MAKGAYIGVDSVARKIKKAYIGIDGVARKVKKIYVGIDGVARLAWSSGYGKFAIACSYGKFLTTEDLLNSTIYAAFVQNPVYSVNIVNDYLFVSNASYPLLAFDIATMTQQEVPSSGLYLSGYVTHRIRFLNGYWLAATEVSGYGRLHYSNQTSGIPTFSTISTGSTFKAFTDVTYFNSRWIACTGNCKYIGYTASLGTGSTTVTRIILGSGTESLAGLAHSDSILVTVASDYYIYYSYDGLTYTSATPFSLAYSCIAYGNGVFVAGSSVSSDGYSHIAISYNGTSWTLISFSVLSDSISKIIFVEGTFIMLTKGYISDGYKGGDIYESSDGINWTIVSNHTLYTEGYLYDICLMS